MASGFIDEPPVGSRIPDPPLGDARRVLRALVFEPVRARERGGRIPFLGCRGFRHVVRPSRLRPMVPAQDEDAAMKMTSIRVGIVRALAAAAIVIGGSSSAFACTVCLGGVEDRTHGGAI